MSAEDKDDTECAICHDKFRDARFMECMHIFCRPCIQGLFNSQPGTDRRSVRCPLCMNSYSMTTSYINRLPIKMTTTQIKEFRRGLENSRPLHVVETITGRSCVGQNYVIVMNSLLWYKVRLFLQEDHLEDGRSLTEYHWSQHMTKHGAMEHVKWLMYTRLERTPLLRFTYWTSRSANWKNYITQVVLAGRCREYPDEYLKPGDHVKISWDNSDNEQDGIYLGNRRVVYASISEDENSPAETHKSVVREGYWDSFIRLLGEGTISVIVYRLRVRIWEDIVGVARDLASEPHGQGATCYPLRSNRHFASYCCTGTELSTELKRLNEAKGVLLSQSPIFFEP